MSRLGRYEVISEIGRGGMGIVYRGRDTALGRAVAIKTISLSSEGAPKEAQQLRERLMREAQAAATLSHPNVVTVYDVGEEGDRAYVVMEFVEGGTLDRVLAEPGVSRSAADLLKVLEDVAHALDYAHAHGIVHRDVKPANIFVQPDGGVKLGDFGIAKVTWSRTMTETGTVVGSPHYMAPEQLKGERVTGRSDQFALAAVAYTLLAGRKPFDADTFASLASKILFEEAPSPAVFGVRLPPEVEQVLRKGMSKDPAGRFVNCTEFAESLKDAFRLPAPAPVSAPAPAPAPPPQPVVAPVPVVAETSRRAVASLILGFFAWIFPAAIVAVILGHISRGEIHRSGGKLKGRGMALAGLIMGYAGVALLPLLIIAAIAIPNVLRSRQAANQASALASLRTINTAAVMYGATYNHYPPSLAALGSKPGGGPPEATASGLIDNVLAAGVKSGYRFEYQARSTHNDGVLDAYQVRADPTEPGTTGEAHFFTDESGVIRIARDGPANEQSPPL